MTLVRIQAGAPNSRAGRLAGLEVVTGEKALFVTPANGAIWEKDLKASRVVVVTPAPEGTTDPESQFLIAPVVVEGLQLHLVLFSFRRPDAAEQAQLRQLLATHYGAERVAFEVARAEGSATVESQDAGHEEALAAATAVVQASWGWDESEAFQIRVNGTVFSVAARFDGEVWRGDVQRSQAGA